VGDLGQGRGLPDPTAAHSMLGRGEANSLLRYRVPTPITAQPNLKAVVA
jgi:hypothetical protein